MRPASTLDPPSLPPAFPGNTSKSQSRSAVQLVKKLELYDPAGIEVPNFQLEYIGWRYTMKSLLALIALLSSVAIPGRAQGVQKEVQEKLAEVKASVAQNQMALRAYTWIEHTDISLKGEVKKTKDESCRYGPDGKVQKVAIGTPAPPKQLRGVRKRVVEKKVGELEDYMDRAAALIKNYVPPSPALMEAAFKAGMVSLGQAGPGAIQLQFRNYVKSGDSLVFSFDSASKTLRKITVDSYLDNPSDAVKLDVNFQTLPDATNYVASTVLNAPAKQVQVVTKSSNFQKLAQ